MKRAVLLAIVCLALTAFAQAQPLAEGQNAADLVADILQPAGAPRMVSKEFAFIPGWMSGEQITNPAYNDPWGLEVTSFENKNGLTMGRLPLCTLSRVSWTGEQWETNDDLKLITKQEFVTCWPERGQHTYSNEAFRAILSKTHSSLPFTIIPNPQKKPQTVAGTSDRALYSFAYWLGAKSEAKEKKELVSMIGLTANFDSTGYYSYGLKSEFKYAEVTADEWKNSELIADPFAGNEGAFEGLLYRFWPDYNSFTVLTTNAFDKAKARESVLTWGRQHLEKTAAEEVEPRFKIRDVTFNGKPDTGKEIYIDPKEVTGQNSLYVDYKIDANASWWQQNMVPAGKSVTGITVVYLFHEDFFDELCKQNPDMLSGCSKNAYMLFNHPEMGLTTNIVYFYTATRELDPKAYPMTDAAKLNVIGAVKLRQGYTLFGPPGETRLKVNDVAWTTTLDGIGHLKPGRYRAYVMVWDQRLGPALATTYLSKSVIHVPSLDTKINLYSSNGLKYKDKTFCDISEETLKPGEGPLFIKGEACGVPLTTSMVYGQLEDPETKERLTVFNTEPIDFPAANTPEQVGCKPFAAVLDPKYLYPGEYNLVLAMAGNGQGGAVTEQKIECQAPLLDTEFTLNDYLTRLKGNPKAYADDKLLEDFLGYMMDIVNKSTDDYAKEQMLGFTKNILKGISAQTGLPYAKSQLESEEAYLEDIEGKGSLGGLLRDLIFVNVADPEAWAKRAIALSGGPNCIREQINELNYQNYASRISQLASECNGYPLLAYLARRESVIRTNLYNLKPVFTLTPREEAQLSIQIGDMYYNKYLLDAAERAYYRVLALEEQTEEHGPGSGCCYDSALAAHNGLAKVAALKKWIARISLVGSVLISIGIGIVCPPCGIAMGVAAFGLMSIDTYNSWSQIGVREKTVMVALLAISILPGLRNGNARYIATRSTLKAAGVTGARSIGQAYKGAAKDLLESFGMASGGKAFATKVDKDLAKGIRELWKKNPEEAVKLLKTMKAELPQDLAPAVRAKAEVLAKELSEGVTTPQRIRQIQNLVDVLPPNEAELLLKTLGQTLKNKRNLVSLFSNTIGRKLKQAEEELKQFTGRLSSEQRTELSTTVNNQLRAVAENKAGAREALYEMMENGVQKGEKTVVSGSVVSEWIKHTSMAQAISINQAELVTGEIFTKLLKVRPKTTKLAEMTERTEFAALAKKTAGQLKDTEKRQLREAVLKNVQNRVKQVVESGGGRSALLPGGTDAARLAEMVDGLTDSMMDAYPNAMAEDINTLVQKSTDLFMLGDTVSARASKTTHDIRHIYEVSGYGAKAKEFQEVSKDWTPQMLAEYKLAAFNHDCGYGSSHIWDNIFNSGTHPALGKNTMEFHIGDDATRVMGAKNANKVFQDVGEHPNGIYGGMGAIDPVANPVSATLSQFDNTAGDKIEPAFEEFAGAIKLVSEADKLASKGEKEAADALLTEANEKFQTKTTDFFNKRMAEQRKALTAAGVTVDEQALRKAAENDLAMARESVFRADLKTFEIQMSITAMEGEKVHIASKLTAKDLANLAESSPLKGLKEGDSYVELTLFTNDKNKELIRKALPEKGDKIIKKQLGKLAETYPEAATFDSRVVSTTVSDDKLTTTIKLDNGRSIRYRAREEVIPELPEGMTKDAFENKYGIPFEPTQRNRKLLLELSGVT